MTTLHTTYKCFNCPRSYVSDYMTLVCKADGVLCFYNPTGQISHRKCYLYNNTKRNLK